MDNKREHLKSEIEKLILTMLRYDFPGVVITVRDIIISQDFMEVKIWIKILGNENIRHINSNIFRYRKGLAKKLKLRFVPKIIFLLDDSDLPLFQ